MIEYLFADQRHQNLAQQQISDIQAELDRIHRVIIIEALDHSLQQQSLLKTLKPSEADDIDNMRCLTKKPGSFTESDKQDFDRRLKRIEHLNNIPGLGINERERAAIVTALNMGQGHWYVCPKGHPYVITEVRLHTAVIPNKIVFLYVI